MKINDTEILQSVIESIKNEEFRNEKRIHVARMSIFTAVLLLINIARIVVMEAAINIKFFMVVGFSVLCICMGFVLWHYYKKEKYSSVIRYLLVTLDIIFISILILIARFVTGTDILQITTDIPIFLALFFVNALSGLRFDFKISVYCVVLSIIVLIGFTIYDLQIGIISNSRIIMNSFFKTFFIGGTGLVSGYTGKRAKKVIIQNYMEQAEKNFITKIFGKYVSGPVADKILSGSFELGGEERKITVLFSDIRNFTPICEKMNPKDVVHFLNEYFNMMVNIIFKYGGTLNKFTGDGFMAIFGAPISYENNEERAISAALEMRVKLIEFNKAQMQNRNKAKISAGMGISTGNATVGNFGSQDRMEYTAIGDTVNTASRIESLCKKFETDILIDEKTYKPIKNLFVIKKKGPVKVKGKEKLVNIYELIKPK